MELFGLASSHAPAMFSEAELWPEIYRAIPEYTRESQPHTAKLETPEVIHQQIARIKAGFAVLRDQIAAFAPEALIVVGDDQMDVFNESNVPSFFLYAGEDVWGISRSQYAHEPLEDSKITLKVHTALAHHMLHGLVERGFDLSSGTKLQPLGCPERGISHMIASPLPVLVPKLDIPIVPLIINEYHAPMPTARRCWDLGMAIADLASRYPARIAIYASGGLSHDPFGPRAGWIDQKLDRWLLERLERNEGERLTSLFTFDSDTFHGGTGEIRAWITVAGACRRPAKIVEYIPSHHAKTGLAFAYWPIEFHG